MKLYGILKRGRGACAEQRPPIGNHGESTEAGCREDPLNSEAFSSGRHRVLSLSSGRHARTGTVVGRRRDCHHVPGLQGVRVVAQNGEGLAAGLTSVFAHFVEGPQRRIIAFNSDSPHLPRSVIEEAFEILRAHDLVVGPTDDGGYYLVGAKASHPTLFSGGGMGTSSALERLLSRARVLELSVGFEDPFYDIDVADDLIRLPAELQCAPARAPRTAVWLKQWGMP